MVSLAAELLADLRMDCQKRTHPDVRMGTLNRSVEACDGLERGGSDPTIKSSRYLVASASSQLSINPTTVEKYVLSRRDADPSWTGPTRVTIEKDPDLKAYVAARESERTSRAAWTIPTTKQQVEDVLSGVRPIEDAQLLRHQIYEGELAKRRLDDVTAGLKKMDFDFESLRRGRLIVSGSLSEVEKLRLRQLADRLTDERFLATIGLELVNDAICEVGGIRSVLVQSEELAVLRHLAGLRKE